MMRPSINLVVGSVLIGIVLTMALTAFVWTPYNPTAVNLRARMVAPNAAYLLGTDDFGRDVLSRLLVGASQSLTVAVLTVTLAVCIGASLGLISGYMRGIVDRVLMVVSDAVLALPGTLLALGLMVIIGPNKYGVILALGVAYAPSVLRIVRSSVLSVREREFVEASRVIGNSEWQTMVRHVLPNSIAPLVVLATSMFGWVVLAESGLSFLGLGVPPPAPTWGNMLSAARPFLERAPWLGLAPGVCISITLLGINLLGDALRDRLDPRMERQ